MALNLGRNLPAVLLLLVTIAAAAGRMIHAESPCNRHLSGNFKGPCWGYWSNDDCNRVCIGESSDNVSGSCDHYKCWCQSRCTSETAVAAASASAPIPA